MNWSPSHSNSQEEPLITNNNRGATSYKTLKSQKYTYEPVPDTLKSRHRNELNHKNTPMNWSPTHSSHDTEIQRFQGLTICPPLDK